MFGPYSKAFAAFSNAALVVLGLVINASLVHGSAAKWIAVAVAALGTLSGAVSVYKVPNAPATLDVAPIKSAVKAAVAELPAAPRLTPDAGWLVAPPDLHAGLSGPKGQWPTETPPAFQG